MRRSPKVGKSGHPEVSKKSGAGGAEPEEKNNFGSDSSHDYKDGDDVTQSERNAKFETATALLNTPENKTDRKIERPTSEINAMEVHHHPNVEKKNFKEYLLEGFMIFIAVMMGFFAESIRENITNGEHVKQLTMQLVRDLKNGTTNLQENIAYEIRLGKKEDSLFILLQQPLQKIDKKRMQWLISKNYNLKLFYPSLGAITAIKNELHLKQFSKSEISTYIAGYEGRAGVLKELENVQKNNLSNYLASFFKDHFTPENVHAAFHDQPIVNSTMRNLVQDDLTRLSVEIAMIQAFNGDLISYDKRMKQDAVNLMHYVTKQYSLDGE